MSLHADPALVITDGGLPGLLACFMEGVCRPAAKLGGSEKGASSSRSAAWMGLCADQLGQRDFRRMAAAKAAEISHMGDLSEWKDEPGALLSAAGRRGDRTRLLMAAGAEALKRGLARVVWPIQLGGSGESSADHATPSKILDDIADACDRATVTARLLSLDAPEGLVIQTPFVDFTDAQLADLAADVDLPIEAAFFGSTDADRERWRKALADAGLPMPAIDHHGLSPTVRTTSSRAASL